MMPGHIAWRKGTCHRRVQAEGSSRVDATPAVCLPATSVSGFDRRDDVGIGAQD